MDKQLNLKGRKLPVKGVLILGYLSTERLDELDAKVKLNLFPDREVSKDVTRCQACQGEPETV